MNSKMETQYITDEQGQRIGVVLDWKTYQNLLSSKVQDPELLSGLAAEELSVLAHVNLSPNLQQELSQLLARNKEELSKTEVEHLDNLLAQVDRLNLLKARAKYTLQQLYSSIA